MESVVFRNGEAYVTVSNTASSGTGVFRTALPLKAGSAWLDANPGECMLPAEGGGMPLRAPILRSLDSGLWLFQPSFGEREDMAPEHTLCALDTAQNTFVARDAGLRACVDGICTLLAPDELKQVGTRLYSNAGGGQNVLVSTDQGSSWRVVTGRFDQDICTHPAFEVVGDRLFVGGECPLDMAFLRAYQLSPDGTRLASNEALPVSLPDMKNRNVQFIRAAGGQRIFAGVEGGLLRSDDGGRSFKFIIQHEDGTGSYPYVSNLLALSGKPDTIVAAGFDKVSRKPYLTWSADGGTTWDDISSILPGYARSLDAPSGGMVTSIAEDAQGRIVLTVNEEDGAKGRLVLVTLGTAPRK